MCLEAQCNKIKRVQNTHTRIHKSLTHISTQRDRLGTFIKIRWISFDHKRTMHISILYSDSTFLTPSRSVAHFQFGLCVVRFFWPVYYYVYKTKIIIYMHTDRYRLSIILNIVNAHSFCVPLNPLSHLLITILNCSVFFQACFFSFLHFAIHTQCALSLTV